MFLLIATVLSLGWKSCGVNPGVASEMPQFGLMVHRYGTRFTGGGVQEPSRIEGGVPLGE